MIMFLANKHFVPSPCHSSHSLRSVDADCMPLTIPIKDGNHSMVSERNEPKGASPPHHFYCGWNESSQMVVESSHQSIDELPLMHHQDLVSQSIEVRPAEVHGSVSVEERP
mmetsp:Transcript_33075/g.48939  ORF Transcript_33075/g.48939 Transcript_33075/m.48939 type:complete len:111 (-) Transcript_33075:62-394(-)